MFAVVFAIMRGTAMLFQDGLAFLLPLSFVLMTLLPFVFLTGHGRRKAGFSRPEHYSFYLTAIIWGIALAVCCYGLGTLLFDYSADHWFMTVKKFYQQNPSYQVAGPVLSMFLVFTIPAMIFSPVGEEIFFRGFLHLALQEKVSEKSSGLIEAAVFGLVHVFHHGLVMQQGHLRFYPLSGPLWMILMFLVALAFLWLKKKSGSIYPAILAHAMFNLTMNWIIFYRMPD